MHILKPFYTTKCGTIVSQNVTATFLNFLGLVRQYNADDFPNLTEHSSLDDITDAINEVVGDRYIIISDSRDKPYPIDLLPMLEYLIFEQQPIILLRSLFKTLPAKPIELYMARTPPPYPEEPFILYGLDPASEEAFIIHNCKEYVVGWHELAEVVLAAGNTMLIDAEAHGVSVARRHEM